MSTWFCGLKSLQNSGCCCGTLSHSMNLHMPSKIVINPNTFIFTCFFLCYKNSTLNHNFPVVLTNIIYTSNQVFMISSQWDSRWCITIFVRLNCNTATNKLSYEFQFRSDGATPSFASSILYGFVLNSLFQVDWRIRRTERTHYFVWLVCTVRACVCVLYGMIPFMRTVKAN